MHGSLIADILDQIMHRTARFGWASCLTLMLCIGVSAQTTKIPPEYGDIPLYFEENRGQADPTVLFFAQEQNLALSLTQTGAMFSTGNDLVVMRIIGANDSSLITGEKLVEGVSNYYVGSRVITGLRHYDSVRVHDIHPGIDIVYRAVKHDLEYDFVVHPRADPASLRLRFEGSRPTLDEDGNVVLKTASGELRQRKPRVWQQTDDQLHEIDCRYELANNGDVRMALSDYNTSQQLIIDPIITYSTYLGGTYNRDTPSGIAADANGSAYIVGTTQSGDFPITFGAFHGPYTNIFVTKLNSAGTGLVYSTLINGVVNGASQGFAIAVDTSGNAYLTGLTLAADFPFTFGHLKGVQGAFAVKLGATGNIVYSTALSGSGRDAGNAIAVDAQGSAYVGGATASNDFPVTTGAYQASAGGAGDAFIAKLSPSGQISYATYLGGNSYDVITAIAVDSLGNIFAGGMTTSANFPTSTGSYAATLAGGQDGFVIKLNSAGSALTYATLLGGAATDSITGVALDPNGNCYVAGYTESVDFPTTPGAFAPIKSFSVPGFVSNSAFVTKLNATGTSLLYSTFLEGTTYNVATAIAVDGGGIAYVGGTATSNSFPTTTGALRPVHATSSLDSDVFVVKLAGDGKTLPYSTALGGTSAEDDGTGLALDGHGGVYVLGTTNSLTYATTSNAFQPVNPKPAVVLQFGYTSAVVTKIDFSSATLCSAPAISPTSATVAGKGGVVPFNLTLSPGCPWEALADSFVTVGPPNASVAATSPVSIAATVGLNDSAYNSRTATVRIGTATLTITQDPGSCRDVTFNPPTLTVGPVAGSQDVALTLPSVCRWLAQSSAPWITFAFNPTGTGPGMIRVNVAANNFSQRSATLTVSGKSLTIIQTQGNCTAGASASPSSVSAQGATGTLRINTSASTCSWNAYPLPPWIRVPAAGASGQGNGSVPFLVTNNPSAVQRSGQILIGDQTVTITQAAGPSPSSGVPIVYELSTIAGLGDSSLVNRGDGGPAISAYLGAPFGLAYDASTGNLFIGDSGTQRIRVITPDGKINTFAGGGTATGDNIPALSAQLYGGDIAVDAASTVYVACPTQQGCKISGGIVSKIVGNGSFGLEMDGPALNTPMWGFGQLAAGPAGAVYFANFGECRIHKVSGGVISTVPASLCPGDIAVDGVGNVYGIVYDNGLIEKFTPTGNIAFVVPASSHPVGIALGANGDIFFGNNDIQQIQKISSDGSISPVFGNGLLGYLTLASLAADPSGNVYFAQPDAGTVLKLTPAGSFCSYSVTTPSLQRIAGGPVTISVTTAAGCAWSATSDIPWITVTSSGATGSGAVQLTLSPNPGGGRGGNIAIAGQLISITQAGVAASLTVAPMSLNFAVSGSVVTGAQSVSLNFTVPGASWTAFSNQSNITVSPTSGTGSATLSVSVIAGPSGVVTITAPGATNSPVQVQVTVSTVTSAPPIGSFDTPLDNTTGVAGAIPVTGWALDNVGVSKVQVWREPVTNEPVASNNLVFVGDAVQVAGARPDVKATYPNMPFNDRAGWGYQLLTNFLPGVAGPMGNGTYKLHFIAYNNAGGQTDLGTRTITVDNAHASKPFGTIDTPGQGDTIAGNAYVNFGWALTQNPYCIPNDGHTLNVFIDGVLLGHPNYNHSRSDIASLFPGLCNSNGGVGFFYIDTTKLANGLHTISWAATDSQGHTDGIGSRYFTIQSSGGVAPPEESAAESVRTSATHTRRDSYTVGVEELDRIELDVGAISSDSLPVGSTLKHGVFYWQLGPGFLGDYHFRFTRPDGTGALVHVKVRPKSYARN